MKRTGAIPPSRFIILSIEGNKRETYVWYSKDWGGFCDGRPMGTARKRNIGVSKTNNKLFMREGNYGMINKRFIGGIWKHYKKSNPLSG